MEEKDVDASTLAVKLVSRRAAHDFTIDDKQMPDAALPNLLPPRLPEAACCTSHQPIALVDHPAETHKRTI